MIRYVVIIVICMLFCVSLSSQTREEINYGHKGLSLGINNNRFLIIDYSYKRLRFAYLNSIYINKIKNQSFVASLSYKILETSKWNLNVTSNLISNFRSSFLTTNVYFSENYNLFSVLTLFSKQQVSHEYTSNQTNIDYSIGCLINLNNKISVFSSFSTIPEFFNREDIPRVDMGFILSSEDLSVKPQLSVPKQGIQYSNLMISFIYSFKI